MNDKQYSRMTTTHCDNDYVTLDNPEKPILKQKGEKMTEQLTLYDFMNLLDKFLIDEADEYDYTELTVHCNRVMSNDIFYIKDKHNHVVKSFVLKKE